MKMLVLELKVKIIKFITILTKKSSIQKKDLLALSFMSLPKKH
jgi:hypothetical protein